MNRIENDIYSHKYEIPLGDNRIHDMLPREVFRKILSYLNYKEVLTADLVSHFWNESLVDVVQVETFNDQKKFVEFLVENIKDESKRNELSHFREDRNVFNLNSLKEIKASVIASKEEIVKILGRLKRDETKELRKLYKARSARNFDHLLAITELHSDLEDTQAIDDSFCKGDQLQRLSMLFTVYHQYDKAVEVANIIPDEKERALTIQGISDALMQYGKMEKSLVVANQIKKEYIRSESLERLAVSLSRRGLFKRAKEVVEMIPKQSPRHDTALKLISSDRIPVGNQKRSIRVLH